MHLARHFLGALSASAVITAAPATKVASDPDIPIWSEIPTSPGPSYTFAMEFEDGEIVAMHSMDIYSECHNVGKHRNPKNIRFDEGWVEHHFYLYSDEYCKCEVFQGMGGSYDMRHTMTIGSWKVD